MTVHGRAVPVGTGPEDPDGLRSVLLDAYVPRYGPQYSGVLSVSAE